MMKRISALACALLCLFAFSFSAFADFGDYGGDYDYGGYDYDYGNDYDYDYGNDYDYDYGHDYDDDDYHYQTTTRYYSLAGYPSGSDGYGGGPDIFNALGKVVDAIVLSDNAIETASDDSASSMLGLLIVVVIAIIIIVAKRRKNGGGPTAVNNTSRTTVPRPAGAAPTDAGKLQSLASYAAEDPGFSEADFREKLSNLYVKLQNAWTDKDLSVLRPYLSDGFYASSDRQLDNYRRNRQTNCIERIAVLDVNVRGWMRQGSEDIMVASLRTRITDYVTDDKTGSIIRGSQTQEKFMEYEWTLARKTGVKTQDGNASKVVNCPNCGAPLNINKTAKCPYCDSIITVDSHDWVLTGIKGISQRTMGK